MNDKTICRNDGRCEYAVQTGAEKEGSCPAGACAMPCTNPAAHLTIPGALEWDGDNGTHGVVGTHSADGESAEPEISDDDLLKMADKAFGQVVDYDLRGNPITDYRVLTIGAYGPAIRRLVSLARQNPVAVQSETDDLRAQLANTEQSRRSFFDLSQDLEKKLEEAKRLLHTASIRLALWLTPDDDPRKQIIAFLSKADRPSCESCGDWGYIETEDSAHDCPECGPSVIERAVEAGLMNAPEPYAADDIPDFTPGSGNKARRRIAEIEKAKTKICIECDQPYCPGVCVERGDQDYDRDQAAKGGDDE